MADDDQRYRLLIESVTDYAIYMLDREGYVSSWNPGAARFKGYTEQEIIGRHFSYFYSPADREAGVPARALETAASAGRFEAEGWRIRKDGARFWAHVVIDPIRTPDGDLIGFAKVTRDLTERQLAEETLQRSEDRFNLLVKSVTDYAIYMLDLSGHVTNWNLGAERIKGYSPNEIIGSHFSRFYTDEDRALGEPNRTLEQARLHGRYEAEGWRVRKDGTRFWANVVLDAIHNPARQLVGFAKVTRDVTEKRQAQLALEKTREALFQSQKMDAIGRLTGGVAHDFNNLLMAVIGSLGLVKRRLVADEKTQHFLENAIQAARRGTALTQRMLAFARRQDLKPTAVDLVSLIDGMSDLLQRSLGPAVQVETQFESQLPPVMVDGNQLELALLNLAVNARDAMPQGGVASISATQTQVASGTEAKLAPGRYVVLVVSDQGEGMNEETLARAVEPFFTTKGVGKGTGLGLPMVDGLAAQSGGRFELKSEVGRGTSAELWLPVATQQPTEKQLGAAPLQTSTRPMKVVAVDDDHLVLMNTVAMLDELGHTTLQASTAQGGLALLRANTDVELLVTDYAMPHMTGAELVTLARAERPGLAVILASGYAEMPGRLSPEVGRLAKPFELNDLAGAIAKIVGPHGQEP